MGEATKRDRVNNAAVGIAAPRTWPVWVSWLAALLGGLIAGAVAKLADESAAAAVGHIGTYLGGWVLLVAIIAAWSRSPWRAVLCAMTFLLAMVAAYYVVQMQLFGFFSVQLLLAWAAMGLVLGPTFAALVWHARSVGWLPAVGAALPVGLLLAEAYSVRLKLNMPFNDNYIIQFVFDIGAAVLLLVILPRTGAQRLRVLALIPVIVLGTPHVLQAVWTLAGRLM